MNSAWSRVTRSASTRRTRSDAWLETELTDSVFAVSADDYDRTVVINQSLYGKFKKMHTFFIRAIDDRGRPLRPSQIFYRLYPGPADSHKLSVRDKSRYGRADTERSLHLQVVRQGSYRRALELPGGRLGQVPLRLLLHRPDRRSQQDPGRVRGDVERLDLVPCRGGFRKADDPRG